MNRDTASCRTKFTVEKRDMWRGPDQYRQLIEQARADNAQQEELKALNAKLTDLFAIFKSFKEDVEYLKGTPEVDDDERAVWSDLEEEVEALRASTPADIDLDTAGALLERLEAEDKAVSERAEQLRANDKKRKRDERDELEEDGELEEDEDYNKDEGEG